MKMRIKELIKEKKGGLGIAAAIFALIIGASSFLPSSIYGSWWWVGIWTVVAIGVIIGIIIGRLWRKIWLFLLHLSLLLILVGGIVTFLFAKRGVLYLEPGYPEKEYVRYDGLVEHLPFSVTLTKFDISYYQNTKISSDYISRVLVDGSREMQISMNRIGRVGMWRLYQSSYDGEGGISMMVNWDPGGIVLTYSGYALFILAGLMLIIKQRGSVFAMRLRYWLLIIGGIVIVAWLMLGHLIRSPLHPVLATGWLAVHVSVIICAYVLLGITFPLSVVSLISNRKREEMQQIIQKLLPSGIWLMGIGIILGSMWANVSWGRYWGWDPKETWALAVMIVYSIPLHRSLKLRHPQYYLILGFVMILMTWVGVAMMKSLHAYN